MSTNTPNYFSEPFNCECLNDKGNEEFSNFWQNSGSCCANLRLTVWLVFNVIFAIAVLLLCFKVRREKKSLQADLENFEIADGAQDEDELNSSSNNDSLQERLK